MPGYRVHDFLTVTTAAALAAGYYRYSPAPDPHSAAILAGACLVSGLLFSPDLDLNSQPRRRWGHAGFLWWPYERLVPHRSWISHSAVAGPILRLAYFTAVTYLLLWWLLWAVRQWVMPVDRNGMMRGWQAQAVAFAHHHPDWVAMVLIGFYAGAFAHTAADCVWSAVRPRRRRR